MKALKKLVIRNFSKINQMIVLMIQLNRKPIKKLFKIKSVKILVHRMAIQVHKAKIQKKLL